MPMHVAVAVSGRGTNLEALLLGLGPDAPARVVLVLSNRADAPALDRAAGRGIPTVTLRDHADGGEWLRALERHGADLLVLAGYLKLVPAEVIDRYRGRILNVHPALLPAFGGLGMYGRRVHVEDPSAIAVNDLGRHQLEVAGEHQQIRPVTLQGREPLAAVGVVPQRDGCDAPPGGPIECGRVGPIAQHQHHPGGGVRPQPMQERFEIGAASGDGNGNVHRHGGRR